MRKLGLPVLLAAVACSSRERLPRSATGAPVLEVRGALQGGPYALGRADLERLPRLKVRGADPRAGQLQEWEGASLAVLVSERVELKRGADTVLARTADRSAIPIPLTVIRQLQPVLADRREGARLATAEIAWPTLDQRGLASDPRAASWWVRDVVALELVDWQRTFGPALAAGEGAPDAARRGAGVYAESCIACHRVRGQGGDRGPELTTVASRLDPQAFLALLPSHPGWMERRVRDAVDESSAEVWAFLRAVAAMPAPASTSPDEATAERPAKPARP